MTAITKGVEKGLTEENWEKERGKTDLAQKAERRANAEAEKGDHTASVQSPPRGSVVLTLGQKSFKILLQQLVHACY